MRSTSRGLVLAALVAATGCGHKVKSLTVEPVSRGIEWQWSGDVKGMVGRGTFSVKDQDGQPVVGLGPDSFRFYQDGSPADRESVAGSTDVRMTLSLVLDTSGSIREANAQEAVVSSAISFVGALYRRASFRVYAFGTEVEELNDLSQLDFDGRFTSLYDAVELAGKNAVERGEERVVIAFTDGRDNRSAASIDHLLTLVRDEGITVHVVGLGDVDRAALQSIAVAGKGRAVFAKSPKQLGKAFEELAEQLGGLYRVSYLSPSRPGPTEHELRMEVAVKKAKADVTSTFVVDDSADLGPRCRAGFTLAEHSDILCCATGSAQADGVLACGTCSNGMGIVPGTNTCCYYPLTRSCQRRATRDILTRAYPRKRSPPPVSAGSSSVAEEIARELAEDPELAETQAEIERLSALVEALEGAKTAPKGPRKIGITLVKQAEGVVITQVVDGGPASEAGIRPGDVIRSIDGVPALSVAIAIDMIAGSTAPMSIVIGRGSETVDITVEGR
ncbi:MAG: VWA domain-containing protein [Alphaproteobacteria bacterium]|nr:VWA domain-containing protein [Alphaproteobacteria bacterium]